MVERKSRTPAASGNPDLSKFAARIEERFETLFTRLDNVEGRVTERMDRLDGRVQEIRDKATSRETYQAQQLGALREEMDRVKSQTKDDFEALAETVKSQARETVKAAAEGAAQGVVTTTPAAGKAAVRATLTEAVKSPWGIAAGLIGAVMTLTAGASILPKLYRFIVDAGTAIIYFLTHA